MKKVKFILISALLFGLLFIAACGDDPEPEENTGTDEVPEQDTDLEEQEVDDETDYETEEEAEETESDSDEGESGSNETESDSDEGESGSNETENGNNDAGQSSEEAEEQVVVMENEAFRIFEPAENAVVDNEFTVSGEANVHEGKVLYEFEDGHNILDEGSVTAEAVAPDWGSFEFTITFDEVWANSGTVIIYEENEETGDRTNQIYIPVTVED